MAEAVLDASALVDLVLGGPLGALVRGRVAGHALHAPAHLDAEALSALGRLHRAGGLTAGEAETVIARVATAPIQRHALADLLAGAWNRRQNLRLADALYVELATRLGHPLVTTDARLRPVGVADIVGS